MGLEQSKEYYKILNPKDIKKHLDIHLIELSISNSTNFRNLTNEFFLIYNLAEEKRYLNQTELIDYKDKYFNLMKNSARKLEAKK